MNTCSRFQRRILLPAGALITVLSFSCQPAVFGQTSQSSHKTLAQRLVESTQQKHPEILELGISTTTKRGCREIASTDHTDIGEKCEKEDVEAMQTQKPILAREHEGFDVSLPLRDASGKLIGSVGIELKAVTGETKATAEQKATQVATEMAAQISSKAALFRRAGR